MEGCDSTRAITNDEGRCESGWERWTMKKDKRRTRKKEKVLEREREDERVAKANGRSGRIGDNKCQNNDLTVAGRSRGSDERLTIAHKNSHGDVSIGD